MMRAKTHFLTFLASASAKGVPRDRYRAIHGRSMPQRERQRDALDHTTKLPILTIPTANVYGFGDSDAAEPVFRDLEWHVHEGDSWAVLGSGGEKARLFQVCTNHVPSGSLLEPVGVHRPSWDILEYPLLLLEGSSHSSLWWSILVQYKTVFQWCHLLIAAAPVVAPFTTILHVTVLFGSKTASH